MLSLFSFAHLLMIDETLWTPQKEMTRFFNIDLPAISKYLHHTLIQ